MYLKSVFLFAFLSTAASVYINELPLYLSDDILISKVSKRSATEKDDPTSSTTEKLRINSRNDEAGKEVATGKIKREIQDKNQHETLDPAENNIVFLPSFRKRGFRRSRRDVENEKQVTTEKSTSTTPVTKVTTSKQKPETEVVQESGLVFLPSFGRRSRRSLLKREATIGEHKKINPKIYQNSDASNQETEDEEESGLVFIPSFGRRSRRQIEKRDVNNEKDEQKKKPSVESNPGEFKDETEDEEESGLVFIPSFGRRSKRQIEKRDVDIEKDQQKDKSPIESHSKQSNDESEDEEESGLVFIPSFGRRTRRDTNDYKKTGDKNDTGSVTTEKEDKKKSTTESENTQESGLVFLPSFGRRTRRAISGDSRSTNSAKRNTNKENESFEEGMEGSENGMVFLTSFGKRH